MTNTARTLVLVFLLSFMAVAAFVAGYFTNDYVELHNGTASAAGDRSEFDLFWEAWSYVEHSYFGNIPPMKQIAYGAIRGALSQLGDPYTVFVEPPAREQERESLRGNFQGIGAELTRNQDGEVILNPLPGYPAEIAGIQSGDILIAVDGTPIDETMTMEAITQLIRGEKGTVVTLTVIHPGLSEPVEIAVERGEILIPSVSHRVLAEEPKIGYIQLTQFTGESSSEVAEAVRELQELGAESLILDLRQNGGGLLEAAVDVADQFLNGGPILFQESKGQEQQVYEADETAIAETLPMVVLIDGGTASSSEIVAGALQDHERAVLIGSPTFGKGSVQLVYDLSDGSSVHVTSSRWLTPDRHQIDQRGLQPDILVEVTQDALDNGRDPALEKAIEYLQNGMNNETQ